MCPVCPGVPHRCSTDRDQYVCTCDQYAAVNIKSKSTESAMSGTAAVNFPYKSDLSRHAIIAIWMQKNVFFTFLCFQYKKTVLTLKKFFFQHFYL